VVNNWKPELGWYTSTIPDPTPLIAQMEATIEQGAGYSAAWTPKVRSRWGTVNLERYLQSKYPHKRILRIDSESVADPHHPAYGVVGAPDEVATGYDIIRFSDDWHRADHNKGHYAAVFGIFQGTTPDSEQGSTWHGCEIPATSGPALGARKIGNGSCNYYELACSTTKNIQINLKLLQKLTLTWTAHDPISLRSWADVLC